jgi:hypothetical protein
MKQVTLDVDAITVLQVKDWTDEIFIHFKGPSPHPKWTNRPPILSMKVTEGTGVEYVREVFGIEPQVINRAK